MRRFSRRSLFLRFLSRQFFRRPEGNSRFLSTSPDGTIATSSLETPGVTTHSVSYVAGIDGRLVAFTGDLIAGEGKVNNWCDLHWDYYGFTQGMDASSASFDRIRAERP